MTVQGTAFSPELLRQLSTYLQQPQKAPQGSPPPTEGGFDPAMLQNIGFLVAQALDPEGFGGRLATGGQQMLQSGILAEERQAQQQTLAEQLGLTPEGVEGPTKMTVGADGRVTTVGNLGGTMTQPQGGTGGVGTAPTKPQSLSDAVRGTATPQEAEINPPTQQPVQQTMTPAGGPGLLPLTGAQLQERRSTLR